MKPSHIRFEKCHFQNGILEVYNAAKIIYEFTHLAKYVYNCIETLPALNCSELTMKTQEESVKSAQI